MKIYKIGILFICSLFTVSGCVKVKQITGDSFIEMCVDNSNINFSDIEEYLLQKKGDTYVIYMTTIKGLYNFKFSTDGILLQQQKLLLNPPKEDEEEEVVIESNETTFEAVEEVTEQKTVEEEYYLRAKEFAGFLDEQIAGYTVNSYDGYYVVHFDIKVDEEILGFVVGFDEQGNPISVQ